MGCALWSTVGKLMVVLWVVLLAQLKLSCWATSWMVGQSAGSPTVQFGWHNCLFNCLIQTILFFTHLEGKTPLENFWSACPAESNSQKQGVSQHMGLCATLSVLCEQDNLSFWLSSNSLVDTGLLCACIMWQSPKINLLVLSSLALTTQAALPPK